MFKTGLPLLLFSCLVLTGCGSKIKPIPYLNNGQEWDKSIVVLGDWDGDPGTPYTYLHWAPVNAGFDAVGEISTSDDHRLGRLYQWGDGDVEVNKSGKNKYYNEAKPKFWYDNNVIVGNFEGESWNNDRGPCPSGWRLPTSNEMEALIVGKHGGYGWTTTGSYAGSIVYTGSEFFGMNDDTTPGTGVFFPAAGWTHQYYGTSRDHNVAGFYWSSTMCNSKQPSDGPIIGREDTRVQASALAIGESTSEIFNDRTPANGYSVRCVHDVD